ncbi:MAG: hypothetical protein LUD27_07975 [Clostridia bacterium]|nr:hypothetical protein [Clostridia bacterium]
MVYVIIGVIAAIAAVSLIIGLVKGYTKTKTWATEYFFAAFLTVLIYTIIDIENDSVYGALVLITAIALLLLFAYTSDRIKSFLKEKVADARKRNYYETYGDREEHFLEIIDAIELNDKKTYEKLTNRKMKEKSGGVGLADRILGGLNLAFKACVIVVSAMVITLLVLQFTQLSFVESGTLYSIYTSEIWEFISPFIFDFLLVGVLQIAIRAGYRNGIIRALWTLVIIALIIGAGYVSYYLAFNVDGFIFLAEDMSADGTAIGNLGESISSVTSAITGKTIAQIIILAALFIISLIVILVFGSIMAGVLCRAREDKIVGTVDGVFGALIYTSIVLLVLLVVGGALYSFNDCEFMDLFNSYCYTKSGEETWSAAIFSSIYNRNPLNGIESFASFQNSIRSFFGYAELS